MLKRYFLITLIDDRQFELPFEKVFSRHGIPQPVPLVPANSMQFLVAACQLSQEGFMEPGTDARPKWINAAQIRHVEVVIEHPTINRHDA